MGTGPEVTAGQGNFFSTSITKYPKYLQQPQAVSENTNSGHLKRKLLGHCLCMALNPLRTLGTVIGSFSKFPYRQPDMTLIVADDNYQEGIDEIPMQKHTPVFPDVVAKRWGKPKEIQKLDRHEAETILQYVYPSEESGWEPLEDNDKNSVKNNLVSEAGFEQIFRNDDSFSFSSEYIAGILNFIEENQELEPKISVNTMKEDNSNLPSTIKLKLTETGTSEETLKPDNEIEIDYDMWTNIKIILKIEKKEVMQSLMGENSKLNESELKCVKWRDIKIILLMLQGKRDNETLKEINNWYLSNELKMNMGNSINTEIEKSDDISKTENEINLAPGMWKDINEILTILDPSEKSSGNGTKPSPTNQRKRIDLKIDQKPLYTLPDSSKVLTAIQMPMAIKIFEVKPENEIELDPGNHNQILPMIPEVIIKHSRFVDGEFHDLDTGLKMSFFYNKKLNEIVISFPGAETEKQFESCLDSLRGKIPPNFAQANQLIGQMKAKIDQYNNEQKTEENKISLRLVGHSLGGAIATYVGSKNAIPFFTFNGMKLGGGLLWDMGKEGRKKAQLLGRRYVVETDWVSDELQGKGWGSWALKLFPDAQHLGKLCLIPKEYIPSDFLVKDVHKYVFKILDEMKEQATSSPLAPEWKEIDFINDDYWTNSMEWEQINFDKTRKMKWKVLSDY